MTHEQLTAIVREHGLAAIAAAMITAAEETSLDLSDEDRSDYLSFVASIDDLVPDFIAADDLAGISRD